MSVVRSVINKKTGGFVEVPLVKMEINMQYQYKGYKYYKENPSLAIWEAIEKILKDCGLYKISYRNKKGH